MIKSANFILVLSKSHHSYIKEFYMHTHEKHIISERNIWLFIN